MLMNQQIQQLLKRNQLSVTDSRSKILELFLQQNGALAHAILKRKAAPALTVLRYTAPCRHLLKKELFILYQQPITLSCMRCAKTPARKGIITTIMYILSAANAVIPFAWKILLCLR